MNLLAQTVPDLNPRGLARPQHDGGQPRHNTGHVVEPRARYTEHIQSVPLRAEERLLYISACCVGNY